VSKAWVRHGAAVGGGAVVLPGVEIGRFALVGAGAVVTRAVPDRGIVVGNPARLVGFACDSAHRLQPAGAASDPMLMRCPECGAEHRIPVSVYRQLKATR
jgi:UDP-2-acetamido-3-amino-2,3-dideoxy-glucuronate N-acetyltransferase